VVGGGVVGGGVVGGGVVGGGVPGGGVVGWPIEPVQATPLRVKAVGAGLLPAHEPLKPKVAVPLVGSAAL
jgi:hypothetical protein